MTFTTTAGIQPRTFSMPPSIEQQTLTVLQSIDATLKVIMAQGQREGREEHKGKRK